MPDWIEHRKYIARVDSWLFTVTFVSWIGINVYFWLWARSIKKAQSSRFKDQVYVVQSKVL